MSLLKSQLCLELGTMAKPYQNPSIGNGCLGDQSLRSGKGRGRPVVL